MKHEAPMPPAEFEAALADIGLADDDFADLVGETAAQIRLWRSGGQAIPKWARLVVTLLSAYPEALTTANRAAMRLKNAGGVG